MARPGLSASRDRPVSGRSAVIWLSLRTASSNPAASSPNVPARTRRSTARSALQRGNRPRRWRLRRGHERHLRCWRPRGRTTG